MLIILPFFTVMIAESRGKVGGKINDFRAMRAGVSSCVFKVFAIQGDKITMCPRIRDEGVAGPLGPPRERHTFGWAIISGQTDQGGCDDQVLPCFGGGIVFDGAVG
jgi:hypothetical protein